MQTLQDEFKVKLREITSLSSRINKNDNRKILEMMKVHVEEIEELYSDKNDHWAIETADLIVLCYELLIMENKSIDVSNTYVKYLGFPLRLSCTHHYR